MNSIRSTSAAFAVSGVVLGAALGLAGPASAEPPAGNYTATVIDGGGVIKSGVTKDATLTPCGPDCTHISVATFQCDLHLQGATYDGACPSSSGGMMTFSLDPGPLNLTTVMESGRTFAWALSKNG
jgi:hypothetical protein